MFNEYSQLLNQEKKSIPYQTRILKSTDQFLIEQAVSIYDRSLGQKYIPISDLMSYLSQPKNYIVLGSVHEDRLLGVMIAAIMTNDEVEQVNKTLVSHGVPINLEGKVGLIKSVAVEEEFRHLGIGTNLTICAMEELKKIKCDSFFSVSWVSNRPDSSQGMFNKLGFRSLAELKNYWTQDSIDKKYGCPNCGPVCYCTAIYYFREAISEIS